MNRKTNEAAALPQGDMDVLRRLAERKAAVAHNPVNAERRRAWYALDSGKGDRVMVLADALRRDYVFSRKPNPTLISTGVFDEGAIRADIRQTLDAARDCRLEIIMKDVHTLNNEPQRLSRWVQIAREEIESCGR